MNRRFAILGIAAFLALTPIAAAQDIADVSGGAAGLEWQPLVSYEGLTLTVSGPDGKVVSRQFRAGERPTFSLFDAAGQALVDGTYTWELRVQPVLTPAQRRELQKARRSGDEARAANVMRQAGLHKSLVESGSFTIQGGSLYAGQETESGPESVTANAVTNVTAADQVIPDDLIVQGSICVGFDCVNNENFGFDTIRLKENNLRIKFQDTSVGTFPTNDWQLTANDSASGGSSKFSIEDITGAKVPFTVTAGAATNSIFVDSTGRVGLRTSTPVLDLHIATSNTPAIRLEQNSSGGFTAQTWDIAGNEANFFVRDVTGGSRLPFRIRPGAPTSSLDISADGDVGVGTASPDVNLHVFEGGAAAQRTLLQLQNNGGVELILTDDSANAGAGVDWVWQNVNGEVRITDGGDATNELVLENDGDLRIAGRIFTVGGTCGAGCDAVFSSDYALESIEEHAAQMFQKSHLPAVGPTQENGEWDLTSKTGGILNELEKAHIYIAQLNDALKAKDARLAELTERLARVEVRLAGVTP